MDALDVLPEVAIVDAGETSQAFFQRGIHDVRAAARWLRDLPYGRNAGRTDFLAVLREGRGTCSTKHAVLANLAKELGISLELRVGIFLMSGANTPRVGPVLAAHGVEAIPEAHCFVVFDGRRVDVTGLAGAPIEKFVLEEPIEPAQVGAFKVAWHRAFVRAWLAGEALGQRRSFEEVWAVREACIAALAGQD